MFKLFKEHHPNFDIIGTVIGLFYCTGILIILYNIMAFFYMFIKGTVSLL